MITITDTKETRQLEDESWKAAIYFADADSAEFLRLKKQAKESGQRMVINIESAGEPTIESLDSLIDEVMVLAVKLKKQLGKTAEDAPTVQIFPPDWKNDEGAE